MKVYASFKIKHFWINLSGNDIFNVVVASGVLSRCAVDHGLTDSNLIYIAAFFICVFDCTAKTTAASRLMIGILESTNCENKRQLRTHMRT